MTETTKARNSKLFQEAELLRQEVQKELYERIRINSTDNKNKSDTGKPDLKTVKNQLTIAPINGAMILLLKFIYKIDWCSVRLAQLA